jgi:hypothetical protein
MRIACLGLKFSHKPCFWVEPSDSGIAIAGIPNTAIISGNHRMRACRRWEQKNSSISPVLGSRRPARLAHMPVHQIEPSFASTGSRERCPSVGTIHSIMSICVSPATSVGRLLTSSGKCSAKYAAIVSDCARGNLIIVEKSPCHSAALPNPAERSICAVPWQLVQCAKTKSRPAPSGKPDCAVAKQDRVKAIRVMRGQCGPSS